jgi:hypothetical protein
MAKAGFGSSAEYSRLETLTEIRRALKVGPDIEVSNTEAHAFWVWRSEQYAASFLTLGKGADEEIIKWFSAYVCEILDNDLEVNPYDV